MLSRMLIAALWSPYGKGLASWLSFVVLNCVFATFQCGIRCLAMRKAGNPHILVSVYIWCTYTPGSDEPVQPPFQRCSA